MFPFLKQRNKNVNFTLAFDSIPYKRHFETVQMGVILGPTKVLLLNDAQSKKTSKIGDELRNYSPTPSFLTALDTTKEPSYNSARA